LTATQKLQQMLAKAKETNPTLLADQGTRKARRLYVGNLPPGVNVTEQMLVDFFNAAVVQAGILMPGLSGPPVVSSWVSTDDERRFAFVEFRTMEECANALSLNGIVFHGESLRISRPSDFDDAVRAMQAQGVTIPQMGVQYAMPAAAPGIPGMPAMPAMGMPATSAAPAATSALMLTHMIKTEDLNDPEDIEDIKADVKDECGKHGQVLAVHIPGPTEAGAGNVYVQFSDVAAAVKAQGVMHGRLFDGQQIQATFYDEAKMQARQF